MVLKKIQDEGLTVVPCKRPIGSSTQYATRSVPTCDRHLHLIPGTVFRVIGLAPYPAWSSLRLLSYRSKSVIIIIIILVEDPHRTDVSFVEMQ